MRPPLHAFGLRRGAQLKCVASTRPVGTSAKDSCEDGEHTSECSAPGCLAVGASDGSIHMTSSACTQSAACAEQQPDLVEAHAGAVSHVAFSADNR